MKEVCFMSREIGFAAIEAERAREEENHKMLKSMCGSRTLDFLSSAKHKVVDKAGDAFCKLEKIKRTLLVSFVTAATLGGADTTLKLKQNDWQPDSEHGVVVDWTKNTADAPKNMVIGAWEYVFDK